MLDADSLTSALAGALPEAARQDLHALASAIIAAQAGAPAPPAPTLAPLFQRLAGQRLVVGPTTLSFDGAQLGDVRIGDVVSGTLIKVITLQLVLAPPGQAAPADPRRQAMLDRVRAIWLPAMLQPPLEQATPLARRLVEQPDGTASPLRLQVQELRSEPRSFPPELPIGALFEQLGCALLILGEPGAGKTRLLCELLRDRLARAEQHPAERIPVLLNLSSWSARHHSLVAWLSDELTAKYDVPRKLSRAWVHDDALLPLLDGLDEVAPHERARCIEAINAYRDSYGLTPLAVCARTGEYTAQPARLRLQGAVRIEQLQDAQVDAYLAAQGERLAGLRLLLERDRALRALAATPLMLNLMIAVFRDSTPEQLGSAADAEQRRAELFERYVAVMFSRRGSARYAQPQLLRWLSWLARAMQAHQQELFLIAQLQPTWLPSPAARAQYLLLDRLGFALLVGAGFALLVGAGFALLGSPAREPALGFGAVAALVAGLFGSDEAAASGPGGRIGQLVAGALLGFLAVGGAIGLGVALLGQASNGLSAGLTVGVVGGLAGALMGRPSLRPRRVRVIEQLGWSWRRALRAVLVAGLGMGALGGLLYGAAGVWLGAASGLGMSLIGGLTSSELPARTQPSQSLLLSLRCMAAGGLLGGLCGGVAGGLTGSPEGALLGALLTMLLGALLFGGHACGSHLALRLVLWGHRLAPLRYGPFLEEAAARILLQRVGGGYRFIHRSLQEHLAARGAAPDPPRVSEGTRPHTPKGVSR